MPDSCAIIQRRSLPEQESFMWFHGVPAKACRAPAEISPRRAQGRLRRWCMRHGFVSMATKANSGMTVRIRSGGLQAAEAMRRILIDAARSNGRWFFLTGATRSRPPWSGGVNAAPAPSRVPPPLHASAILPRPYPSAGLGPAAQGFRPILYNSGCRGLSWPCRVAPILRNHALAGVLVARKLYRFCIRFELQTAAFIRESR